MSSGYSYLQEFLPHVAQACVREGWFDAVGLGRMVLSYPELPADVLAGRPLARKQICRTFSDCTTAPRNGLVSGCYPLDPFYRERPERERARGGEARARPGERPRARRGAAWRGGRRAARHRRGAAALRRGRTIDWAGFERHVAAHPRRRASTWR